VPDLGAGEKTDLIERGTTSMTDTQTLWDNEDAVRHALEFRHRLGELNQQQQQEESQVGKLRADLADARRSLDLTRSKIKALTEAEFRDLPLFGWRDGHAADAQANGRPGAAHAPTGDGGDGGRDTTRHDAGAGQAAGVAGEAAKVAPFFGLELTPEGGVTTSVEAEECPEPSPAKPQKPRQRKPKAERPPAPSRATGKMLPPAKPAGKKTAPPTLEEVGLHQIGLPLEALAALQAEEFTSLGDLLDFWKMDDESRTLAAYLALIPGMEDHAELTADAISMCLTRHGVRSCQVCGCTQESCEQCIARTSEPCSWVGPRLCSACQVPDTTPAAIAGALADGASAEGLALNRDQVADAVEKTRAALASAAACYCCRGKAAPAIGRPCPDCSGAEHKGEVKVGAAGPLQVYVLPGGKGWATAELGRLGNWHVADLKPEEYYPSVDEIERAVNLQLGLNCHVKEWWADDEEHAIRLEKVFVAQSPKPRRRKAVKG